MFEAAKKGLVQGVVKWDRQVGSQCRIESATAPPIQCPT